jgi:aspartate-semialdehyde dehydrogenase
MNKKQAIILGATGAAGQNVVEFTAVHPWFEIACLSGSERSHNKSYREATSAAAFFREEPHEEIMGMRVVGADHVDPRDYDVAFSALPSEIAKIQEAKFGKHIPVISTAAAYRYEEDTPVLLPDVNPTHIEMIEGQRKKRGWNGYIVPGPNCTTIGLVTSLKPLLDTYGVDTVSMVSMQSLSGAGEKGLRADSEYRLNAVKNVIPLIEGEEGKVVKETNKILGNMLEGKLVDASINIHATCTRVDVEIVHTEAVHLGLGKTTSIDDIRKTLNGYRSEAQLLKLPSVAEQPIIVVEEADGPQPKKHGDYPKMVTLVGRLRENPIFRNGVSYVLTSDNLEKGAGGGAVLSAEYLKVKGLL